MRVVFINFRSNPSSALIRTSKALSGAGVMVNSLTFRSLVKEDFPLKISMFSRWLFTFNILIDLFITRFVYQKSDMFFSRNLNIGSGFLANQYNSILNNFDLVHLHWIGHGFISTDFLLKLNLKKLVITFHDYYFITGGCHVPIECEKYIKECRNCPARSIFYDFQLKNFNEKKKLFQRLKVFAIAPSQAMAAKIRNSELGRFIYQVMVVPNPIDTEVYKPIDFCIDDREWGPRFPENKKVVLMVANDLSDRNKGLDLLVKALTIIKKDSNFCLVTVGGKMPIFQEELGFEIIHLRSVNEATELIKIYNKAYMTVVPSLFESFSQVTLESLACGTPVVAFDSNGPSEIISNDINGLLAQSFSEVDLGKKIERLLVSSSLRSFYSKNARKMVEEKYSYKAVGELNQREYNRIINC